MHITLGELRKIIEDALRRVCRACNGEGSVAGEFCATCGGEGYELDYSGSEERPGIGRGTVPHSK